MADTISSFRHCSGASARRDVNGMDARIKSGDDEEKIPYPSILEKSATASVVARMRFKSRKR
ncbi:MAG: hypothetical protein ABW031_01005, partial [Methyloceanibacter sp.]